MFHDEVKCYVHLGLFSSHHHTSFLWPLVFLEGGSFSHTWFLFMNGLFPQCSDSAQSTPGQAASIRGLPCSRRKLLCNPLIFPPAMETLTETVLNPIMGPVASILCSGLRPSHGDARLRRHCTFPGLLVADSRPHLENKETHMSAKTSADRAAWIQEFIRGFVEESTENSLRNPSSEKAFTIPLVGFSRGDDPLYESYKDHVGPFYMTPWEVFTLTFRDFGVKASELTVISWILPQTDATKADNRKKTRFPSERWARARVFGEQVNVKLREHVVSMLKFEGYQAVAPIVTPQFSIRISPRYGLASTWSERHAAYASGLGTFGLCDGLITAVGKAMRTGSVVARMKIPPTKRPYSDHREYCLFFSKGICGKCISRCPAGAITEAGKDKSLCFAHLFPATVEYVKSHYGFDGYACGLCQTGVPCESKIPTAEDVQPD